MPDSSPGVCFQDHLLKFNIVDILSEGDIEIADDLLTVMFFQSNLKPQVLKIFNGR